MLRFTFFALLLLMLSLALYAFGIDLYQQYRTLSWETEWQVSQPRVLASWLLQAMGLTALFLLLYGRSGNRWLDGLATAWVAWIFRGPLLVLTLASTGLVDPAAWWRASLGWLGLYTWCGLLLASLSRSVQLEPSRSEPKS